MSGAGPQADRVGRILHKRDFETVLAVRPSSRSTHFAVHHVARAPQPSARRVVPELSTGGAPERPNPVDDLPPGALWLGAVVPKRCARRAVTRTLIKRQIRAALERHAAGLPSGLWVVRLRAPFDRTVFRSAASDALRAAARDELDTVLARAAR
jgi:ribonuclease P protein component